MRRTLCQLVFVVVLAGCDQIAAPLLPGGNGGGRLPAELRQPNIRNELLKKLQGQSLEHKLQTLLDLVKNDSNETVRRDALQYLCGLGHEARPIAESLAEQLLIESSVHMVPHLKETLVAIDADVETYLVTAAASASESQKLVIVGTLGELAGSKPETLSYLLEQLKSNNQTMVVSATEAVRRIGPAAIETLPKLIELAGRSRVSLEASADGGRAFRESRELQDAAIRAIAAIGANESAIEVLIAALSQEASIAKHAAEALAVMGPAAARALPQLQKLVARNDHWGKDVKTRLAREAAEEAIQAIQRPVK